MARQYKQVPELKPEYRQVPELTPEQLAVKIWGVLDGCARYRDGVILMAADVQGFAQVVAAHFHLPVEDAAQQIRAHLAGFVFGSAERVFPDAQRRPLLGMLYALAEVEQLSAQEAR